MKHSVQKQRVPESFDEWTLFESVFTEDHVALVYRWSDGTAWCVAEEVDDECYATLFLDGDKDNRRLSESEGDSSPADSHKYIQIKASSLLVVLNMRLDWSLVRVNNTIEGGAAEVYDYVEY